MGSRFSGMTKTNTPTPIKADLPSKMKALVIEEAGRVVVKEHPVPVIGDDEILVRTVAVSQNPTDWKHVDYLGKPGTVIGCDFSGNVVQVGKNVTGRKVGEHVAGWVHGGAYTDGGAFAEYVKTVPELTWLVPPNTLTHEQAASLGVVLLTAVQALYHPTRLGLVEPPQKAPENQWILIYGGSSGVGQAAIQLAHLSGYKVVSTASPRNFDLVKSYGADVVFDYRDPEVVSQIKQATGDSIVKALDCISSEDSQRITAQSIAPSGGKMVVLVAPQPEAAGRDDVEIKQTLLYTALGRAFSYAPNKYFPASPEDKQQIVDFLPKLTELVRQGAIKPLPIRLWEGGLDAIPDGLQFMRDGKVSAQKIVYHV